MQDLKKKMEFRVAEFLGVRPPAENTETLC